MFFLLLAGLVSESLDTSEDGLLNCKGDCCNFLGLLRGLNLFSWLYLRGDLLGLPISKRFSGDFIAVFKSGNLDGDFFTGLFNSKHLTGHFEGLWKITLFTQSEEVMLLAEVDGDKGDFWGVCCLVILGSKLLEVFVGEDNFCRLNGKFSIDFLGDDWDW